MRGSCYIFGWIVQYIVKKSLREVLNHTLGVQPLSIIFRLYFTFLL